MGRWTRDAILGFLEARLGPVPEDVRAIQDVARLDTLVGEAGRCRDFAAFRARLPS